MKIMITMLLFSVTNIFSQGIPSPPTLLTPNNGATNQIIPVTFNWTASANATAYRLQVAEDSLFNNLIYNDSSITSTTFHANNLLVNSKYYWRVQAKSINGNSNYSETWELFTIVQTPVIVTIGAGNKRITLTWTQNDINNIKLFKIFRNVSTLATTLIDSVTVGQLTWNDTNIINGTRYYYRIKAVTIFNTESNYSNERSAVPYNIPPIATQLNDIYLPNEGRVLKKELTFTSQDSYDPDGTIDSVYWYVNDSLIQRGINLVHNFLQGTNKLKLIVEDNDGSKDSSIATINISAFKRYFGGPIHAGLSLIGGNDIYIIASGDAIFKIDSTGQVNYNINVNGNILSSTSIAFDTTIYVGSSDNNLYAFSKYGNSLWPALPLGGALIATPVVDTIENRIYIGVANRNFVAVNRLTGNVEWSFFSDAPIGNSAVITTDRKLVFTTNKGTVYGINLNNVTFPITPNWIISDPDSITSSPAIDNQGYFYVETKNGLLKKISMQTGLQGVVVWATILGGEIIAAPIIDANGNIYVGSTNNNFYALNKTDGLIKWSYQTTGPIKTTGAISGAGTIYFGNSEGELIAIDTLGNRKWYYKDSTAIGSAILHSNGTTYIGTLGGRVLAFYDGGILRGGMETTKSPMWGTFQGNNRRTGSQVDVPMSIDRKDDQIPTEFHLFQNYPNPFNPKTVIKFSLPERSSVSVTVYNVLGEIVTTLLNNQLEAGFHSMKIDAASLSSGIYFYVIKTDKNFEVKKMILLK